MRPSTRRRGMPERGLKPRMAMFALCLLMFLTGRSTASLPSALAEISKQIDGVKRSSRVVEDEYFGVELQSVGEVEFMRGEYTAANRVAPILQLNCEKNELPGVLLDQVVCHNAEVRPRNVLFQCRGILTTSAAVHVYDTELSCEGYTQQFDTAVLRNSCGLTYSLAVAPSAAKKNTTEFSVEVETYGWRANIEWGPLQSLVLAIFGSFTALTLLAVRARKRPRSIPVDDSETSDEINYPSHENYGTIQAISPVPLPRPGRKMSSPVPFEFR